jgi:hypothetical protein
VPDLHKEGATKKTAVACQLCGTAFRPLIRCIPAVYFQHTCWMCLQEKIQSGLQRVLQEAGVEVSLLAHAAVLV